MSLGALVAKLMAGGDDPRAALLAAVGAPQPAGGTAAPQGGPGAAGAGAPATPVPGPGQQPPAPPVGAPSPPDLSALYSKLMNQEQLSRGINSGAALIAAGFAQPENKAGLMQMAQSNYGDSAADGVGGKAGGAIGTLLELQKLQQAQQEKVLMRARLPMLAKQYGIDLTTMESLFATGRLDEVLQKLATPDTEVVRTENGRSVLINKRTGQQIGKELTPAMTKHAIENTGGGGITAVDPYDPTKSIRVREADPEYSVHGTSGGGNIAVNKRDPNDTKVVTGPDLTPDLIELNRVNRERKIAGQSEVSAEDWLREMAKVKAPKTAESTQVVKMAEAGVKDYTDSLGQADSSKGLISLVGNAHSALDKGIISGSVLAPGATEARKVLASTFGLKDEVANNTDLFMSQLKEIVLPKVKMLGTGNSISNADVSFIEKAVGSNTMDANTIREIMIRVERLAREKMLHHNQIVDDMVKNNPEIEKYSRKVAVPPPSSALMKVVPPQAMDLLRKDPKAAKDFDAKYGSGMASYVLEGK